ncbi:MAG: hypothetical protein WED07_14400 [Candidatus Freyarchaeum deiterrae]
MHETVRKREEAESIQNFEKKVVEGAERPCRGCENLIGVSIQHDTDEFGRAQLNYIYSCRGGLFLSAIIKEHGGCPINSFKPRVSGEVELAPESLSKNGFRKLSYENDLAKKLDPNHPRAKRYGEIVIHPGEDALKLIYQIYDVWVKQKEGNSEKDAPKVLSRVRVKESQSSG